MRKSKDLIAKVSQQYADTLLKKFPGLVADISTEPWEGSDAWIEFGVPEDYTDDVHEDVLDQTVRLSWEFREKTGVKIIASLTTKEAVHG
jgi:hypothetical protein